MTKGAAAPGCEGVLWISAHPTAERLPHLGSSKACMSFNSANDRGKYGTSLIAQLAFRVGDARKFVAWI
jgi:hypothetical protein